MNGIVPRRLGATPLLSLLLVPIIAGWWGESWYRTRPYEIREVLVVSQADFAARIGDGRTLEARDDGAAQQTGVQIGAGEALRAELPSLSVARVAIQADNDGEFEISLSEDGVAYEPVWVAPMLPHATGMRTRTSPPLVAGPPARFAMVAPRPGDRIGAVSRITVDAVTLRVSPLAVFTVGFWAMWIVLRTWNARGNSRAAASVLRFWHRHDHWVAALAATMILFEFDSPIAVRAAAVALLGGVGSLLRYGWRRGPAKVCLALLSLTLTAFAANEVASRIFAARLHRAYDSTVDHRMLPDGAEINSDGIRFAGEHDGLDDADFNILFLGDSFTLGVGAGYTGIYPYAFERYLADLGCKVRSVNFGWISSSPLLSLRLLEDIGARYKPDLILYSLDLTDFHDDLRYAAALRDSGEAYSLPTNRLWTHIAGATSLGRPVHLLEETVRASLRQRMDRDTARRSLTSSPKSRFFVVEQPLALSKPYIESGVVKNLAEMHRFAIDELNADFALVLFPRAFQYSRDESPDNWERHEYEAVGAYSLEPFRYFEEAAAKLGYPVISLLDAFRNATEFPLFKTDDPHWNEAGNEVAARGLADELIRRSLLPGCE